MKVALAFIALVGTAAASPGWSLGELFTRSKTVAVVTLDRKTTLFVPNKVLRGAFAKRTFQVDQLPSDTDQFVVVSQGDKASNDAQLGQGIEGQNGFQGWLIYPVHKGVVDPALLITADGKVRVDQLPALLKKHPYKP